jgi:hypothetical protein
MCHLRKCGSLKPFVLKVSVANSGSSEEAESVYEAIQENLKDAECYRLRPLDGFGGAAIDFVAILQSAAAIAGIANFVYNVWKNHRKNGQLYVCVDPERGVQIMITDQTTEIEIEEFQKKINSVVASGCLNRMDAEILEDIKRRRIWIKTK